MGESEKKEVKKGLAVVVLLFIFVALFCGYMFHVVNEDAKPEVVPVDTTKVAIVPKGLVVIQDMVPENVDSI